jgi:hypothetical protein
MRVAVAAGQPIHSRELLRRQERKHRLATHPLYLATQMLAGLYIEDRREWCANWRCVRVHGCGRSGWR